MIRKRKDSLVIAICVSAGLSSLSVTTGIAQTRPATPAFSCADTTALRLGFLVGEYDVRAIFRTGPSSWDSTTAKVTITRDLDGCVIREHFRGTRYGSPYEYLAYWSAHGGPATPIQRSFVHSQHGLLSVSYGRVVADSLFLEDSAFVRERWIYQRVVLWRETGSAGNLQSESRRSEDARTTWFVTQRTFYSRRPR